MTYKILYGFNTRSIFYYLVVANILYFLTNLSMVLNNFNLIQCQMFEFIVITIIIKPLF